MKKILITGSTSYIGENVVKWLANSSEVYDTDTISVRNKDWNKLDFSKYDVILHLAGIAHVSTDPRMKEKYYKVNRDLTIKLAEKAKSEGVKQFIFMSSIIVYGDSSSVEKVIDLNTVPSPSNFYGDSKLQAENGIKRLENESFKVVVIRPPMIYGKDSKGNYPKLAKIARKTPVFPNIINQRSMLHIDNLCELIRLIIVNNENGVFFPQNAKYVQVRKMISQIAEVHGNKIWFTKAFNPFIRLLCPRVKLINKVFGNLIYDKNLSEYKQNYRVRDFKQSISLTERGN
ncbi:NAD-dependent epimerase/dehydratase family protein [Halobacillus litoralis]|uniref:NAD-dependent epimerase/dehydratase family protein n=1 Tax=Halobacillus litoralis TaxID=45668 RepID=A0A845F6F4_9BACI|nr:NAD-dependent epimerase/dehydratase family protein [Halobacillus litoralis]MYL69822.1 NAD-dependent epimerase/dehydratase family protein [Halobacillus litoralis]